ncbi:hypothetical protein MPL3356_150326 [Mesorhizobium plurifarium]|uniref:Uncharacterized protein n=1 Tax=Mesorhizobium plurifarium TaxID=69974 RepID=A0A090F563_MESPL|nr:hypothetical protein MPL3356_150326 [Mesorhizobium plurifarium]
MRTLPIDELIWQGTRRVIVIDPFTIAAKLAVHRHMAWVRNGAFSFQTQVSECFCRRALGGCGGVLGRDKSGPR